VDDDGPGWEQLEDNERRRWDEEQAALNRCRRLTRELRDETKVFEREMNETKQRIETNWSELHGNSG
jgi:hypothetical protein